MTQQQSEVSVQQQNLAGIPTANLISALLGSNPFQIDMASLLSQINNLSPSIRVTIMELCNLLRICRALPTPLSTTPSPVDVQAGFDGEQPEADSQSAMESEQSAMESEQSAMESEQSAMESEQPAMVSEQNAMEIGHSGQQSSYQHSGYQQPSGYPYHKRPVKPYYKPIPYGKPPMKVVYHKVPNYKPVYEKPYYPRN